MSPLRAALLLVLSAALAGCGFHLRGATVLPEAMTRTELRGAAVDGPLSVEVAQVLRNAGGAVVGPGEGATAVLHVANERVHRRVASVNAAGNASEYELRYVLTAALNAPDGEILAPQQTVTVVRTYNYDTSNVLGASNEEELLLVEMRRQAVRQLLRQINRQAQTAAP
ncbi:MAG: LPS assembly lipoprotein LptE [Gammaproteobacteria bacterium]|nr:LPS assembly lipoprotein LptE [Gammaproteobacteria bacterium]